MLPHPSGIRVFQLHRPYYSSPNNQSLRPVTSIGGMIVGRYGLRTALQLIASNSGAATNLFHRCSRFPIIALDAWSSDLRNSKRGAILQPPKQPLSNGPFSRLPNSKWRMNSLRASLRSPNQGNDRPRLPPYGTRACSRSIQGFYP